jgi:membrane protease YdiL (CAAX protease family)
VGSERAVDGRWHTPPVMEVAALTALILSYIWGWQGAFPGHAQLIVLLYFGIGIAGHLRRGETAAQLGIRLDNWGAAFRNALPVVAVALLVPLAVGAAFDTWHFPSWQRSLENLPWTIAWGTAQQYGLVCLLYRRLLEIVQSPWAATLFAAALFAVFHTPNPLLMVVTLIAGIASCTLYRREPNLFVLGFAHAAVSYVISAAFPLSVTHGMHVGPAYFWFS